MNEVDNKAQVVCVGEVLFDMISDEPGVPLDQVKILIPYPGGAPANVACALSKLGTKAAIVGAIGQDKPGAELIAVLQSHGVDTSAIQFMAEQPTRSVLVTRNIHGDRLFAAFGQYLTSDQFADTRLDAKQIPIQLIESARYLVVGTLPLAYPASSTAVTYAIDCAKKSGVKVVIDVNWRPIFWPHRHLAKPIILQMLVQADYLKLTDEEAIWLFGFCDVRKIHDRFPQLQVILLTMGDRGCIYWVAEKVGKVPAFKVPVEDTTGAGDSFLATFLHQLCQRNIHDMSVINVAKIVAYASAAGALTTMKPGAISALPTAAALHEFCSACS